eukprot:CAMPEP_0195526892 /NCGR_PEP_ID=MMETSP0794_2-20130614/28204_1 /TAXON_ID=515487 /ORGANISM="Stephanopyxis turris, Strain CCMP 815" /LENGTH=350 /DNA_ID=CAMNT_0040657679 /DNA_START=100 /DNA_END=1152 /DNA_ORIENTATION=+
MGWYHAVQLLDEERSMPATLKYIVEPWYMSEAGKSSPGSAEFAEWRKTLEQTKNIEFFATVKEVPLPSSSDEKRVSIISARTSDNPNLLKDCISIQSNSIYLEKPGAPTVSELESMRDSAKAAGVTVLMGFNKNVSKFVTKTRNYASTNPGTVTFVHNNAYENNMESLGECFERNSEGMLKNMAIHELALLVKFYGASVDNIAEVIADTEYSSCQTLKGPSGNSFTDFDKLKFTIKTKDGKEATVAADRCGGDDSVGIVTSASDNNNELFRYSMPDEEDLAAIPMLEKKNPGAMPYFYVQDPDYWTLKERVAKNCLDGTEADGVASIDVAVDTLKLAEYLTPILTKQLLR